MDLNFRPGLRIPDFLVASRKSCFLLLPLLVLFGCGGIADRPSENLESQVAGVTEGLFGGTIEDDMQASRVPGVSIAVISDNKIAWSRGFGVVKAGSEIPVTPETVFPASSISKAFTSALALKLVEERRLDLQGPINHRLSSWQVADNEFTKTSDVTLLGLLDHSACVNRPKGGFGYEGAYPTTVQVLNGELPATNLPAQIECVPGTEIRYSNMGYVIVQKAIEDVAGQPFARYAQDLLLNPIQMTSSTFQQPLDPSLENRAAFPHDENGQPGERFYNPGALGQGGLWTTPSDLGLFAIEVMKAANGEPTSALSSETVKRMLTPGHRTLDGGKFWGLGLLVLGNRGFFQAGSDPGFRSLMAAFPGMGKAIVVMVNGDGGELLQLRLLFNFVLSSLVMPRIGMVLVGTACFLLLVSALLARPVAWLVRRVWKRTPAAGDSGQMPRAARFLAVLNTVLVLVGASLYFSYFIDPVGPLSWSNSVISVTILLAICLTVAVLSAMLVYLGAMAWKEGWWTTFRRIHFSMVAVAALGAGWFGLRLLDFF